MAQLPPFGKRNFPGRAHKEKKWLWRAEINREENKATRTFSVQVSSSFFNRHGVTSASTQNQQWITIMEGPTVSTANYNHTWNKSGFKQSWSLRHAVIQWNCWREQQNECQICQEKQIWKIERVRTVDSLKPDECLPESHISSKWNCPLIVSCRVLICFAWAIQYDGFTHQIKLTFGNFSTI